VNTSTHTSKDNYFFDLSGRQIANPQRGVYIKNGKKVVIK